MRKKLGLLGDTQIDHIAKILENDYEIVNGPSLNGNQIKKLVGLIDFFRNTDVVYRVYSPAHLPFMMLAKLMRAPVVIHWIGSDVLSATDNPILYRKIASQAALNITCYEELQNELADVGIAAEVIPIVPFNLNLEIAKMPERHSVIVYLPKGREELYGLDTILEVASSLPDLEFNIVANDSTLFDKYPNIKALGTLSPEQMEKLYDQVSIVLRNTKHDGLSMSVIEGLAKGKHVIWNHAFEGSTFADTPTEIYEAIKEIIQDTPKPNSFGHQYIKDNYNKKIVRSKTIKALEPLFYQQ